MGPVYLKLRPQEVLPGRQEAKAKRTHYRPDLPNQNSSRCQHHDVLNRRCRVPRIDTHPSFCYIHAQLEWEVRDADWRRNKFLTRYGTFRTYTNVNQALGRVFNLLSQNRIHTREAAALTYTAQLLLQTLDGVKSEAELAFGVDGYQNIVLNVVDPLPDPLPEPSSGPGVAPHAAPAAACVPASQTGAST